jgi:hypothetical protein
VLSVGPYPLDQEGRPWYEGLDGGVSVAARSIVADVHAILEGVRGPVISLESRLVLEKTTWNPEMIILYRVAGSKGTAVDWRDRLGEIVEVYDSILAAGHEPVFSAELLVYLLSLKVPCVNRDPLFAQREATRMLESQGLRLAALLGLTREDLVTVYLLETPEELAELLGLEVPEEEEEGGREEGGEDDDSYPFPDGATKVRHGNYIRLLAYWTCLTGLDPTGKAIEDSSRPDVYNLAKSLRYSLHYLRVFLLDPASVLDSGRELTGGDVERIATQERSLEQAESRYLDLYMARQPVEEDEEPEEEAE